MAELSEQETAELAEFIGWVRQCWKAGNNPESRRAWENSLRDAHASHVNAVMWKGRHDDLAERFDRAVEHARAEAVAGLRALERARALFLACRTRKTVPSALLGIAVMPCDTCDGQRPTARMWNGRPMCEEDYQAVTSLT